MMLSATDLRAGYGANLVLQGAQFALGEGSICGIIGPNGAGKTTLLRSLYGLLPLQSGEVRFDGRDITRSSPGERLRAGIGYVPQERNVFPNLTVTENLELGLIAFAPAERARRLHGRLEKIFALFPRLAERRGQLAGLMSGGEQRMVALGIGLMAEPRVLFLDEPTTGLAPLVVHQLMATIKALNRDGLSTVVVEQNVLSLLDIVDELYLVKAGRCTRYEGDPRSLGQQKIWEYM
jgi:branched-chain amino acid transport system ATP-binding protein